MVGQRQRSHAVKQGTGQIDQRGEYQEGRHGSILREVVDSHDDGIDGSVVTVSRRPGVCLPR